MEFYGTEWNKQNTINVGFKMFLDAMVSSEINSWWVVKDSNLRPLGYEPLFICFSINLKKTI